ncbi:hypothetical protein DSO57_1008923 [Entomophthora muscae]|uniref:Uncharacterized protein n=1 Tax=Entomophthora muscae TaxID=34485 RepID=A0ACC2T717_9FUNG|nr:hypothetical protein DSO57_1008923 [Entomophthora muscae]
MVLGGEVGLLSFKVSSPLVVGISHKTPAQVTHENNGLATQDCISDRGSKYTVKLLSSGCLFARVHAKFLRKYHPPLRPI